MTLNDAARALALVLRAENELLTRSDAVAAARLLAEKQAAIMALQAALPGGYAEPAVAAELRDLAQRNRMLLSQAIQVQARIVEMVARAARAAAPPPARYGARGTTRSDVGAMALALRA